MPLLYKKPKATGEKMKQIISFIKSEIILTATFFIALITAFFVPPSAEYFGYLDYKVLSLLFCLMAVVAGLEKEGLFRAISGILLRRVSSQRALSYLLVLLCFFSSMLVTNDVALLAFVPLTILLADALGKKQFVFVVIMQTVAANLGSMLTPVGNPQNLYLYSFYGVSAADFFSVTVPLVGLSFVLISLAMPVGKNRQIEINIPAETGVQNKKRLCVYWTLFLVSLLGVFSVVHYLLVFLIVCVALLVTDCGLFRRIDYGLPATFVCFFIFVGNINQLETVKNIMGGLMCGKEYPVALVLSQVISNVPAAVMLSAFTDNYRALIAGTDIGGLGTPVASLASLISLRLYMKSGKGKMKEILPTFLGINFLFLIFLACAGGYFLK